MKSYGPVLKVVDESGVLKGVLLDATKCSDDAETSERGVTILRTRG